MTPPQVVRSRTDLAGALAVRRGTVGLVPTMGGLHDGHTGLFAVAKDAADVLVASVFVNPTQFAPGEDLDRYPRTFDADLARCEAAGVDLVFAPGVAAMYPDGPGGDSVGIDPGPLAGRYEGAARPTHFAGVLLVVVKLLELVRPSVAVFGEKDYQQLVLVRHLVRALCLPVDVLASPTAREPDGLARSTRNRYLSTEERGRAVALSAALYAGAALADRGSEAVLRAAHEVLAGAPGVDVDYLALTDNALEPPRAGAEARLLVAARVGNARLLDNMGLRLGAP